MLETKLQALPLLASLLGDKLGVDVVIGEKQNACTDGSIIHLPALPIASDEVMEGLVNGYIDHEAAHIRHTDFALLKQCSMTPLESHICNIFEDWRVEREIVKRYPGCRAHFEWLIRHLFLKKSRRRRKAEGNTPPAFAIPNYALLTVRSWSVPDLRPVCRKEADIIKGLWPGLLDRMDNILSRVHLDCWTTMDSVNLAKEFAGIVESCMQNLDGATSKDKEKLTQENDQGEADSDDLDNSSALENPTTDKEDSEPSDSPGRQLEKLLHAGEDELPLDFDNRLSQAIGKGQAKGKATVGIAQEISIQPRPLSGQVLHKAMASSRAMRTKLQGLLQSRLLKRTCPSRHGRISGRLLHRIAAQNPMLFQKHEEVIGMSSAVHILLDISGSMSRRIELASMACYSVASALSTIPSISVGVSVFPATMDNFSASISPLVRHGERVSDLFGIEAGGTTPLTEALWWVVRTMVPLAESRKIILVITDGYPDDFRTAEETIAALKKMRIEIMGIGIEAPFLDRLIPQQENIRDIQELAPAMFRILQKAL